MVAKVEQEEVGDFPNFRKAEICGVEVLGSIRNKHVGEGDVTLDDCAIS